MDESRAVSRRNFLRGRLALVAGTQPGSAELPHRSAHAVAIAPSCFAKSGIACQSCGDACPHQAISFRPRVGSPFLPELDDDACTGCGACIDICPAGAISVAHRGELDV